MATRTKTKPAERENATDAALAGKLTIRHFLHHSLPSKESKNGRIQKYPLYVRISLARKQADFKSQIDDILSGEPPRKVGVFDHEHLANQAAAANPRFKQETYLSENEFREVEQATSRDKDLYALKRAIQLEHKLVYEIADLLRRHKYNLAEEKNVKSTIMILSHPIYYPLENYLKAAFDRFLLNSESMNGKYRVVYSSINWNQNFRVLYTAFETIANNKLSQDFVGKFKVAIDLYSDLDRFIDLNGTGNLSYQWSYFPLFEKFKEFYQKRLRNIADARDVNLKLSILRAALLSYSPGLGPRIFPPENLKF